MIADAGVDAGFTKSPNGAEDLGLRARQVKTLVEWKLARKIVAFKLLTKQPISYKLGDVTTTHTTEKFSLKAALPNLKLETEDLKLIRQLENITQKPNNQNQPTKLFLLNTKFLTAIP